MSVPKGAVSACMRLKYGVHALINQCLTDTSKDISPACIYLTAKLSSHPQTTRSICNVYAYLLSPTCPLYSNPNILSKSPPKPNPESYYLSETSYHTTRLTLLGTESIILRSLGFVTQVSLPHHLALTYLQTMGVLPPKPTPKSKALAQRTLAHLNTALLSPQLLYLTHQPPALAVAAVYLAAREVGVKLPGVEWWEVFDVDREELGFLVVAFGSLEGWVRRDGEMWEGRCPVGIVELEGELKRRAETND